jgi:hypothetical protein
VGFCFCFEPIRYHNKGYGQYSGKNTGFDKLDSYGVLSIYLYSGGDDRLFPAGGAGIFYQLNDEKMVVRADFAIGKNGNRGFYLKFGQPF